MKSLTQKDIDSLKERVRTLEIAKDATNQKVTKNSKEFLAEINKLTGNDIDLIKKNKELFERLKVAENRAKERREEIWEEVTENFTQHNREIFKLEEKIMRLKKGFKITVGLFLAILVGIVISLNAKAKGADFYFPSSEINIAEIGEQILDEIAMAKMDEIAEIVESTPHVVGDGPFDIYQTAEDKAEVDWIIAESIFPELRGLNLAAPWQESNKPFFSCITNHEKHPHLSPVTKSLGCYIFSHPDNNLGEITITSGCGRKRAASQHSGKYCTAMDYFFKGYPEDCKGQIRKYIDDLHATILFLDNGLPVVSELIGFGIYPRKLIYHIDTRGRRARWSEVDGKYVGIRDGLEVLKKKLKVCKRS